MPLLIHHQFVGICLLLFCLTPLTLTLECSINTNCHSTCLNMACYFSSMASLYNNSIYDSSNSTIINDGKSCCQGCIQWYFYNSSSSESCSQGNCLGRSKYWHYSDNNCYQQCPSGFGNPITGRCQVICPWGLIYFNLTSTCVRQCPEGYYNSIDRNDCTSSCLTSPYLYTDDVLARCVTQNACPYDPNLQGQTYAENSTKKCIEKCPDGSYGHPDTKICVRSCYGNYPYRNLIINRCVQTEEQSYMSSAKQLQMVDQISKLKNWLIAITVIFVIALVLLITGFFVYQCYFKQLWARKPWKFQMIKDISFQSH